MGSRLERILVVKPMPCTSLITGPKDIKAIAQEIGAQPSITGKYTVDCEKVAEIPSITWTIAGKEYEVEGKYLVIQRSGMCIFAMMGMDFAEPGPKWILSDLFMRQYYTVFDYEGKRVGFASLRLNLRS